MDGIEKYDANAVFEDEMKGQFTQLDREEENAKAEKRAHEVLDASL